MTSTKSFYPLTTTFTPPPECASLFVADGCTETSKCYATVFPNELCASNSQDNSTLQGCYPSSSVIPLTYSTPQTTYSPGRICPLGMTTAASALSPDGVWCCPTGLSWAGEPPLCSATLSQGTFIVSNDECSSYSTIVFGRSDVTQFLTTASPNIAPYAPATLPASNIAVTAVARGIFLWGQTMEEAAANTATTLESGTMTPGSAVSASGSLQQNPDEGETSQSPRSNILIGSIVGSVVGALTLIGLVYYALWHRKRARQKRLNSTPADADGSQQSHEHVRNGYGKPELDAGIETTRSELEGPPVERRASGAGIYVQKSELQGTQGTSSAQGCVYVKKKAELEAPLQEPAELEAIPWSTARRESQTLSSTLTTPRAS
ncbi:hypothetical protein M434DRAFT_12914 [Hypoxylon sp. CO27-5]|nr:hypothetical protein M434DRAFT_12914 [Hypoxylon sp. CO27-5]